MTNLANNESRGTPWFLIIPWLVTACFASGMAALVFEMPSLWGGRNSVLEYLIPLPLSWGMLHWPGLILFSMGLGLAYQKRAQWLRPFRQLCVGIFLAVLVIAWISETLRGFPLLMFLAVDALTVLLFAGAIRYPIDYVPNKSLQSTLTLIVGPTAIGIGLILVSPYFMSRYNFVKSDTTVTPQNQKVIQYTVYPNYAGGDPAKECKHLKRYSATRQYYRFEQDGYSHQQILLYRNKAAIRYDSGETEWVSYDWWPDGRVVCSSDAEFR